MGGAPNYPQNEAVAEYSEYTGYTQETVITGLSKPAGIDVIENRMIVSEYETGEIIIYDITVMPAWEMYRINTGMSSVQGIKIGPDGRIWFVDGTTNGVYKIEVAGLGIVENTLDFNVYPNPTTGELNVLLDSAIDGVIEVRDVQGKLIHNAKVTGQTVTMNINALAGMYFVSIINDGIKSETKRIIIQ